MYELYSCRQRNREKGRALECSLRTVGGLSSSGLTLPSLGIRVGKNRWQFLAFAYISREKMMVAFALWSYANHRLFKHGRDATGLHIFDWRKKLSVVDGGKVNVDRWMKMKGDLRGRCWTMATLLTREFWYHRYLKHFKAISIVNTSVCHS